MLGANLGLLLYRKVSVIICIQQPRYSRKINRTVQGVPQSQAAANPRHQEEEKMTKLNHETARSKNHKATYYGNLSVCNR